MAANFQLQNKSSLDEWSVREKLVLACCVIRSGDQNWASVSRTIKPICESVQGRTPEWFSQKNCANQYSDLLEGTSTKKRKRTSSESGANETPMEQIIRKLSFERIDELKKSIQVDRKKYKKLKSDIEKIRSGKVDDQLQHIWNEIRRDKKFPIENIIPEDIIDIPMTLGLPTESSAAGFASCDQSSQQQQQQSSALYHRTKSQRQPKTTKKFETWMTQLKQQQARHHQGHSGSTHTSPHGQQTTASSGPTDAQMLPASSGVPHTPPLIQLSAFDCPAESGSVLSSLLTAPTSEIKAAAAMQLKVLEENATVKDATSAALMKTESFPTEIEMPSTTNVSISAIAPTLSKLLGSSSCDTSPSGSYNIIRPSISPERNDVPRQKDNDPGNISIKNEISDSLLKKSPMGQKPDETSPTGNSQKKRNLEDLSRHKLIEPLHITVEDEEYLPENESSATPDSSQTSPHSKGRKLKGRRGMKKKQLQHLLIKNLEALQDSEDTGSIDEQTSERDEIESELASIPDTKDTSDAEQDDSHLGEDSEDQKMIEEPTDVREQTIGRRQRGRRPSSTSSGTNVLSPSSPTLSTGSNDPDNVQAQRNWRKSIMLVWKSIASHKYANVFMHPVTNDEAPGYDSIIKRPIDLSTIKKNIETGALKTTNEFQRDMMLMFQNALMYNRADHDVYRMAEEMRGEVMEQIQSFIATQFHVLVQSADRDTMMLRGHRSEGDSEQRKTKTYGRTTGKNLALDKARIACNATLDQLLIRVYCSSQERKFSIRIGCVRLIRHTLPGHDNNSTNSLVQIADSVQNKSFLRHAIVSSIGTIS
eukprot:gene5432-6111_t